MKTKYFSALACVVLTVLAVGCVSTVSGRKTAAVPFMKDRVEGRYQVPAEQLFTAAKDVIRDNGTLLTEAVLHAETNWVKTAEGKVNQRSVFVRVEQIEPKISSVLVQARTKGGGTDIDLAHQLEKEVALKLAK